MRVIAGSAGGLRLVAPEGEGTRPTSDRVKEAWFSSLHPRLPGAAVLDLWSGSGALGLEAASRGAARVVVVERDREALAAIATNVASTGLDVEVAAGSLPGVLAGLVGPFDVVVGDPPYRIDRDELAAVLEALVPVLAEGAEVWLETGRRAGEPPWPDALLHDRSRRYGDTALHRAVLTVHDEQPGGGT